MKTNDTASIMRELALWHEAIIALGGDSLLLAIARKKQEAEQSAPKGALRCNIFKLPDDLGVAVFRDGVSFVNQDEAINDPDSPSYLDVVSVIAGKKTVSLIVHDAVAENWTTIGFPREKIEFVE